MNNKLNRLSNANAAAVQPAENPASPRRAALEAPHQADSIESRASENSWGDSALTFLSYILGCAMGIFSFIFGWIQAGIERLMGSDNAAAAAERPAQNPVLTDIEREIQNGWNTEDFFRNFEFPCKLFCVVKIYPAEAGEALLERRFGRHYEESNYATYSNNLNQFFAEIRDELAENRQQVTPQNRIEMVLTTCHKLEDVSNSWRVLTGDRQMRRVGRTRVSSGNTTMTVGDRSAVAGLCQAIQGLDASMMGEILDMPPGP